MKNKFFFNGVILIGLIVMGSLFNSCQSEAVETSDGLVNNVVAIEDTPDSSTAKNPEIRCVYRKPISIKINTGKYVSSEDGKKPITANRTSVRSWEKFTFCSAGTNKYTIQASNGRYLSSENGERAMTCNRTKHGNWEVFTVVKVRGTSNKYTIKGNNGKYVSSNNGKSSKGLTCDRSAVFSQEKFVIDL